MRGRNCSRADRARPFERHVLVEMGDACLPDLLVDAAHYKRNVDGHHRRLMALDHQDRQAVGQFVLDDAIGQTRRRRRGKVKVEA